MTQTPRKPKLPLDYVLCQFHDAMELVFAYAALGLKSRGPSWVLGSSPSTAIKETGLKAFRRGDDWSERGRERH